MSKISTPSFEEARREIARRVGTVLEQGLEEDSGDGVPVYGEHVAERDGGVIWEDDPLHHQVYGNESHSQQGRHVLQEHQP